MVSVCRYGYKNRWYRSCQVYINIVEAIIFCGFLNCSQKTTDLSQVTDKLYHIMMYTSPWSRFEVTTSVVIGSCKSNYHTNMATTALHMHWRGRCMIYNYLCNPGSSTNKTDRHDIAEILLKMSLNTINQTKTKTYVLVFVWLYETNISQIFNI